VYLVSPAGTRVKLFAGVGSANDNFTNTTLDDEATTSITDGTSNFTGRFRPQGRLSDFDGSAANGTWRLEIEDTATNDAGTLNSWSVKFTSGERSMTTGPSGNYTFNNLSAGAYVVRETTPAGYTQTAPPSGAHRLTLATGQSISGRDFGNFEGTAPQPASVAGRHLCYNHSRFDNNDAAANAQDDAAVATNKSALRPGQQASFSNLSGYSRGINGIMVDIANLPGTALDASDFAFKTGNDNQSANWTAAPAPASVTLRRGAGVNGSDRVTITWADGAVRNTWLQVTVLPNGDTGLGAPDVFYFGNLIGFTGRGTSPTVTGMDVTATRRAYSPGNRVTPVGSAFDHNRDGAIDAQDAINARTNLFRRLRLIAPGGGATGEGEVLG
jgi:hypothetical protein